MTQPLNPSEKPDPIRDKPRCALCGDVIGSYEPMILVEDGEPRKTSPSAKRDRDRQAGECYHAACYPRRTAGDAIEKPRRIAGLFLSRSVSRILSLGSHPSVRSTWTSAGRLQAVRLDLAPGGVYPAAASPRRWCALTAPFHPCPSAVHVGRRTSAVCFCGTFPRVSPGRSLDHLALWCPDFPRDLVASRLPDLRVNRSASRLATRDMRAPRSFQCETWPASALDVAQPGSPVRTQIVRSRPTTRPSTRTSLLLIGSIVSFSGCSRM